MFVANEVVTPACRIQVAGGTVEQIPWRVVESVVVDDELSLPAMFTIKINLFDFPNPSLWSNIETLKPGIPVTVAMETGESKSETLVAGEIAALELEAGAEAALEVQGYDLMHRLRYGTYCRSFFMKTDSQIAAEIAAGAGLRADVENSVNKLPSVYQNNQSNYHFLLERARRLDYEMLVREKTFIFRKSRENQAPVKTLEYGIDLRRLTIRLATLDEGVTVEVRGWDIQNKRLIAATAGTGRESNLMKGESSGAALTRQAYGGAALLVTDETVVDARLAQDLAEARYNAALKNFIVVEGECPGDPVLRAGETVSITGVGGRFNGVYYLTATSHRMDQSGYQTTFKGKRTGI